MSQTYCKGKPITVVVACNFQCFIIESIVINHPVHALNHYIEVANTCKIDVCTQFPRTTTKKRRAINEKCFCLVLVKRFRVFLAYIQRV